MVMGQLLRDREAQYVANRDENTQTWRILDTWHDALRSMSPEDDIDDDNPALTILTEGGFIALIKEAARLGVLQNVSGGSDADEEDLDALEEEVSEKDDKISSLEEQVVQLRDENLGLLHETSHTEEYELKEIAMSSILKLVSMADMTHLSGD